MGSAEHLIREGAARPHRTLPPAAAWTVLVVSTVARSAVSVLVVMLLWALVPPAFGLRSTVVMSGSMTPAVQVGDVIVARPVSQRDLGLGNVVLVEDPDRPGRLRLHRLIGVRDGLLQLRGDANPAPDSSLVRPGAVRGVAFLRVPLIGLPIVWVRTGDPGAAAAACIAVSALLLAVRTSRLLPGGRPAPFRRAAAGAAGLGVVVLVATASVGTPGPAWAAFSSATGPAAAFTSEGFPCLSALPAIAGLPAPTIAWAFAETSGATSADLGTTGSTARLTGSYDRVSGSCLQNDGPSVRLGTGARAAVTAATAMPSPSSLTMSVWFRAAAPGGVVAGPGLIAGFGSNPDGSVNSAVADRQLLLNADGSLTYRVGVALGVTASITTPAIAQDGSWHHAVVTLNGTLGTMAVFVDGVPSAASTVSLSLTTYTAYLRLGADGPGSGADYYRGSIGRTELWSGTVVTAAQVAALYAAGR